MKVNHPRLEKHKDILSISCCWSMAVPRLYDPKKHSCVSLALCLS